MSRYILALDQGTTSSRAILFNRKGAACYTAQKELAQIYPSPGHVEHDPEAIWRSQLGTARSVMKKAGITAKDVAAIGITNQRETIILWDRHTGQPIQNAIVWQSRISIKICQRLQKAGHEATFRRKTGLRLDPYFSGSKIAYMLEQHKGLRRRASRGEILCGTVDCFLLWRLTGGKVHATDYSNASRTLIYNIHRLDWDDELLAILKIPRAMLPEVRDCSGEFGNTEARFFGKPIPITGIAGDQQAATFGQECFGRGMIKNTYGTGCFLLMNTGSKAVRSKHGLLTTIGWGLNGKITYCLEGSVFIAGAAVQWLRDGLGIIKKSGDIEKLAASVEDSGGVYFVPAFVGLGAPHWNPFARGSMVGLTRGSSAGHIARAALESMAFQSTEIVQAMATDSGIRPKSLKVDGGAASNDLLMQFQADISGLTLHRPKVQETTALGAAYLAGLGIGFWQDLQDINQHWILDRSFTPQMKPAQRRRQLDRWQAAIQCCLAWAKAES